MSDEKTKKKVSFIYNFKEYASFLKKYKWIFIVVLLLVLVGEFKSLADKFLFKIIIDKGTLFSAGTLSSEALVKILITVAIIFGAFVIANSVSKWFYIHFLNRLESRMIFDLKKKYFDHIVELDHGFHVSHKTGSLISRLSRGTRAVERMTDTITFNVAPLLFQLVILIISLIYLDLISAIIVLVTIIVFVAYSFFIQKSQQQANLEANEAEDIEKGNVADIFTNIDSIKYFGKENYIKQKFTNLANKSRDAMRRHWDYFRWSDAIQIFILSLGTFFLIYFPIKGFLAGQVTLGTLTFIYTSYLGILSPLYGFIHGMREYYRSMADFEDLFEYGKVEKQIKDSPDSTELKIREGKVEFKDVSFNYGKRKIFRNFNLTIPKNKKIALVGHSGSGKTTLVKLLYRLYDLDCGEITVDGKPITSLKQESLRSEMAIVPQECILFDDTVYNNVAFSKPSASREEVMKAIKFAQLDKIINKFENKEQTIVGERGVKLSGGEKQRVSIARAILADKKILVLDEATSALDSETEHEIQNDLEKLMEGRTSIIIAHRLSTIMKADIIIVMKNGEIVQKGTHRQLINQQGEYKKLWNLQKGGYLKE